MKFINTSLRTIKNKIVDVLNFITRVIKNKNTKYNLSRLFFHIIFKLKIEKKNVTNVLNSIIASTNQMFFCKKQKIDLKKTITKLIEVEIE